jgi:hypothetical protein
LKFFYKRDTNSPIINTFIWNFNPVLFSEIDQTNTMTQIML